MADHVRRVEWTGTLDPNQQQWTATGQVDGLDISPELRSSLPAPLADQLEVLAGLRAPADLKFSVSSVGQEPPRFSIDGSVARGRRRRLAAPLPADRRAGRFSLRQRRAFG